MERPFGRGPTTPGLGHLQKKTWFLLTTRIRPSWDDPQRISVQLSRPMPPDLCSTSDTLHCSNPRKPRRQQDLPLQAVGIPRHGATASIETSKDCETWRILTLLSHFGSSWWFQPI